MVDEIKWLLTPDDIEWEMDWSGLNKDGTRQHPDKPETEIVFEPALALAHLLMNEIIFLNDHWFLPWPQEAKDSTSLAVNCGDVFAWGSADAERALYRDIEPLYKMWQKDPVWGAAVWCVIKRKELPQGPVAKRISKAGIWDLEALTKEHALKPNFYDGVSHVLAQRKYDVYCAWEESKDRKPREFDNTWWDGWREYIADHPDWYSDEWKAEDARLKDEWIVKNGHGPQVEELPSEPIPVE